MKLTLSIILLLTIFTSCNYFQKDKEDNTLRNLGILSIINNANAANSSSSSTSGNTCTSGMIICIPKGIAE